MKSLRDHPQWLWLEEDALRDFENECNLLLVGAVTFRDRKWTVGVTAEGDLVVRQGVLTTPMIPHYVTFALQARARRMKRKAAASQRGGKAS